jgi:hypothetical protein
MIQITGEDEVFAKVADLGGRPKVAYTFKLVSTKTKLEKSN